MPVMVPVATGEITERLRNSSRADGLEICTSMEVHISNPSARDEFRKRSVISPVATGTITGMGFYGYKLAIEAVAHLLEER